MTLRITILGCGSSGGVPRPGMGWGACDPANPKNRRRRCSVLVERIGHHGITRVLVDTGPDLREQLLAAKIGQLDGVVLTHEHADHTHGIDDLRPLVLHMRRTVDVYADAVTGSVMLERFRYIFDTLPGSSYPPIAVRHQINAGRVFSVEGEGGAIEILPLAVVHGDIASLALKIDKVMYLPDVSAIPVEVAPCFDNLDVWIIDALRHTPHPAHFSLAEALAWIGRAKPRQAVLTNLHTDLDHAALSASLPAQVRPAHDGMQISIERGEIAFRD
ncbi:MAG: MBL fold metallo-hydrolase [Beijerinckiaceae bacterium]|jgi:phosphoribosyl 1,2-cyclic phosphate phosphodiesterase|nr:MBL fold metallo-hydrolase [Beijerinckiaceae bacterium]